MTANRLLVALVLVVGACSTQAATTGAELFVEVGCQSCHMDTNTDLAPTLNGIWGTGVAMTGGESVIVGESYVRRSITDPQADIVAGYENERMPTFDLSDEEVTRLMEYVRSLS